MKKICIYILIIFNTIIFLTGCVGSSSKKSNAEFVPRELRGAVLTLEYANNKFFSGEYNTYFLSTNRAVSQLKLIDNNCNIARVYIQAFQIQNFANISNINKAHEYAKLGGCPTELNIADFVLRNEYSKKSLPQPYSFIEELLEKKNYKDFFKDTSKSSLNNYIKSGLARMATDLAIKNEDYKNAKTYIDYAYSLDFKNAYTSYLLLDIHMMITINNNANISSEDLLTRKQNILDSLDKNRLNAHEYSVEQLLINSFFNKEEERIN